MCGLALLAQGKEAEIALKQEASLRPNVPSRRAEAKIVSQYVLGVCKGSEVCPSLRVAG